MKTPFSIALIRQRYAQDGGAERFVARMLEALKNRDVRITLVTRRWEKAEGADVLIVNPFYVGRLWRDGSFARAVCRALKTRSFDLVQSHERIACCDIYRAGDGVHREWLRQRARALSWWGRLTQATNPYHLYIKWAEKRLFTRPRLKAAICNSRMVREEIKHYFGLPDEKLPIIHNGVDIEVFHPRLREHRAGVRARHGIPEDASLFLFVGSGFERKGVAALLEALAQLPSHACLLIVGRDKRMEEFRRRADRLGLGTRAIFAGSQADVKPYYGSADVLVLPTLYDPFPNVVLEAMASGLPVITSTKCGAAELVESGGGGMVCDALDVPALGRAMQSLLVPERAAGMGRAARAIAERFDLGGMARELSALYGRLV